MSAADPSGPSQPTQQTAYNVAGNAASKEPAEQGTASQKKDQSVADKRIPSQQVSSDEAKPTSLGQGVRGAGPGEDPSKISAQDAGMSGEVSAEQMGAPGEDKVADAVKSSSKSGSGGSEPGLETDLDKKKAEQAPAREAQKEKDGKDLDVGGILGQRSAPADPRT